MWNLYFKIFPFFTNSKKYTAISNKQKWNLHEIMNVAGWPKINWQCIYLLFLQNRKLHLHSLKWLKHFSCVQLTLNAIVESFFSLGHEYLIGHLLSLFPCVLFFWNIDQIDSCYNIIQRIRNQRSGYIHPCIRLSLDRTPKCTKGKEAKSIPPLTNGHKNYCMPFKIQCIFWVLTSCNLGKQCQRLAQWPSNNISSNLTNNFIFKKWNCESPFCSSLSVLCMNLLPTASWKWFHFQIWWPKKLFSWTLLLFVL